jgi:membrane-bound ClpP family serine protease
MTSIWARALAVVVALPLSAYAIGVVSNGWTYNDSGAITYPIIAAIPAFLGVLLLGLGLALGAGVAGLIGALSSVRTMSRRRGSVPGSPGHELH